MPLGSPRRAASPGRGSEEHTAEHDDPGFVITVFVHEPMTMRADYDSAAKAISIAIADAAR